MDLGSEAFAIHRQENPTLFESFLAQAKAFPKQEIVSDSSDKRLTYQQLLTVSTVVAHKLKHIAGPRVGVLLPPLVGGVIANVALVSQGFVPINLNYTLSRDAIEKIIQKAGITKVITSEKMLAKMAWEKNERYIFLDSMIAGLSTFEKFKTGILLWVLPPFVLRKTFFKKASHRLEDDATIMFTSGSTGIPKGVCLTQANILSNIQSLTMILQVDHRDVILGVLPFFHSFGFTGSLWFPLLAGFKATYHNNPLDSKTIGELCQKEKVTFLMGTPTFLSAYIRRVEKERFASLRFAVAGAEKLRPELAKAFEEKYGVPILEGYGCTELSPVVALNVPDIMDGEFLQVGRKVGKIGRPIPGVSVKIVDPESGQLLKPTEKGLLLVKGPNVMKEYLDDPHQTAEVLKDGWYNTGDIAMVDDDGFIEITDRLSRFSKIGGEMVPHIMVEQKLHELTNSVDRIFVVTSIPDDKKGEALVVLVTGFTGDLDQLWKDLNSSDLPKLWIPARDKFFVIETIPVLGSGKVDMRQVKKNVAERKGIQHGF
jgi:acyl-[acyl-carrier-protein]-phospholipid O-acyltransferase/long-chain-fatty-acid--[acyl-carrier-protein] ligase